MANEAIRKAIQNHGLKQWEVAEALGINETVFCKQLRHELPENKQREILEAIKSKAAEGRKK